METQLDERLSNLEQSLQHEFREIHVTLTANRVALEGVEKRLETRVDDHAAANLEQHSGINANVSAVDGRVVALAKRVNGIDRETAVTKAKVGLWGVAGGGSLLAIIEAIQRFANWKNGG
jgi:hypothetical protein